VRSHWKVPKVADPAEEDDSDDELEQHQYQQKERAVVKRAAVTAWCALDLDGPAVVAPTHMAAVITQAPAVAAPAASAVDFAFPVIARVYIVTVGHELICLHSFARSDEDKFSAQSVQIADRVPRAQATTDHWTDKFGAVAAFPAQSGGQHDVTGLIVARCVVVLSIDAQTHALVVHRIVVDGACWRPSTLALNDLGTHLAIGCHNRLSVYEAAVTADGANLSTWEFEPARCIAGPNAPGPQGDRSGIGEYVRFGAVTALAY
jgi:hypothetical protein